MAAPMEGTGDQKIEKNVSFSELGLNEWLVDQCKAVGITAPTPIQKNCLPKILSGKIFLEILYIFSWGSYTQRVHVHI